MDVFRKRRDDVDPVFAAIKHQQKASIAQKGDNAVGGVGVMYPKAERRSDNWPRASRPFRVEIKKIDIAFERRQHVMGQRDGDGRLANSAWTSQRDEAIAQDASRQILEDVLSSDHPLQPVRQQNRCRLLWRCSRRWTGELRRRRGQRAALDGSDEAVSRLGTLVM